MYHYNNQNDNRKKLPKNKFWLKNSRLNKKNNNINEVVLLLVGPLKFDFKVSGATFAFW